MDTPLPPFGVRGLNPPRPFGLLQLSENDYDACIKSYPSAVLTWHDEDDGETITVGRGSELRERLQDPLPVDAPLVSIHNAATQTREETYIHLFDISRTGRHWVQYLSPYTCEHDLVKSTSSHGSSKFEAAESFQSLSSVPESTQQSSPNSVTKSSSITSVQDNKDAVSTSDSSENSSERAPELVNLLGNQLGNLAAFLQGTSEILRRVAEKTREADTTPIDDVLSGMTTIMAEVGAFGLDILEAVDNKLVERTKRTAEIETDSSCSTNEGINSSQSLSKTTNEDVQRLSFTDKGDVDMSDLGGKECDTKPVDSKKPAFVSVTDLPRIRMGFRPDWSRIPVLLGADDIKKATPNHLERAADDSSLQRFPSMTPSQLAKSPTSSTVVDLSTKVKTSNNICVIHDSPSAVQNSIMDQDAEDADFAARYPPLTSLRRAKTIGCLRGNETITYPALYNSLSGEETFTSTKTHTSRPSPQIFDAETQRRKDFARSCFPTQEYTPGPGAVEIPKVKMTVPILKTPRPSVAFKSSRAPIVSTAPQVFGPANTESSISSLHDQQPVSYSDASNKSQLSSKVEGASHMALPGAWPNNKPEKTDNLAHPIEESSGDFFNRMVHQGRLRSNINQNIGPRFGLVKEHGRQPRVERSKTEAAPIRRAHTVNTTNPAARLTYPFDPLFPPILSAQKETDPSSRGPKHNVPGPIRSLHRSSTERRPRSLYEPYRPFQTARSFSPVWEDHLQGSVNTKNNEDREPLLPKSTPVQILASNFGPEFTEEDIRAVVEDHCRDAQGRSGLKDCTIIAHHPVIAARLVVKDMSMAEQLIAIFDGMTLGGRLLRFSHWLKIQYRREESSPSALGPAPAVKGPQRMRSMPTFASSARAAPLSVSIASKPTIIPSPPIQPRSELPPVRPVLSTRRLTLENIDHCEQQLKVMGYGADDPALMSRLHVYAAAANGDVEEAIELIDEDKQASCVAINTQENKDLEWALRTSQQKEFLP